MDLKGMTNSILFYSGGSPDHICFLHTQCLMLLLIKRNYPCSLNKFLQWKLSSEINEPSEFCLLTFYNALLGCE